MACTGLVEIFWNRGRRSTRSVHWLPVFALTVILANLPSSISSPMCPNGTYHLADETTTSAPSNTEVTTSSWTATTAVTCHNCNATMPQCVLCEFNKSVVCQQCIPGYELTNNNTNCTESSSSSNNSNVIIGVVVGVVGSLIVVGIIVGIVFGVRKGAFERCHCPCGKQSHSPPPMPHPEELGVSFTSKNENESGTGQRVDLRYTDEPGAPQNTCRVESVHYDGYIGQHDDDSVYMNDPSRNIPATVQEENEEIYANEDNQDDELYANDVNTEFSNPSNQSIAETPRNTTTTPVPGSSKPSRPGPKPKPPQKPTSATKTKTQPEHRESMYPPENPEDIYANEPESEDDDEDYVNTDGYQPGKR